MEELWLDEHRYHTDPPDPNSTSQMLVRGIATGRSRIVIPAMTGTHCLAASIRML